MELGLQGRVALVTGGSQGIGRAIALTLASEGADLAICARRQEPLEAVADELRALGCQVVAISADVATPEGVAQVFDEVNSKFEQIDVLVNNAGKGSPKPLLEAIDDDWYASLDLNFMSAVRLSRACVPGM